MPRTPRPRSAEKLNAASGTCQRLQRQGAFLINHPPSPSASSSSSSSSNLVSDVAFSRLHTRSNGLVRLRSVHPVRTVLRDPSSYRGGCTTNHTLHLGGKARKTSSEAGLGNRLKYKSCQELVGGGVRAICIVVTERGGIVIMYPSFQFWRKKTFRSSDHDDSPRLSNHSPLTLHPILLCSVTGESFPFLSFPSAF